MLNPAIKVKKDSAIEGTGLESDRLIPAGEVLFRFDDTKPPVHLYEIVDWPPQKRIRFLAFASQIGSDDYSFRQGDIKFINHSCDPTGWWESYGTLTARREIEPGEEITYDYSTADITLGYQMKCLCGSTSCRGLVTNQDYLDPSFQKKYSNHLPEHVVEAFSNAQCSESDSRTILSDHIPDYVTEAVRQAKQNTLVFRIKFGDQYIFEMVRQAVYQVRSSNPEFCRERGEKYIFEVVRALILSS